MSNQYFSIKKEIDILLNDHHIRDLDSEEIYNEVENDDLMLNSIQLSIFQTIQSKLKEKSIENDEVECQIQKIKYYMVQELMNRGII
ncbi:TPA: hypothetical protein N2D99_001996 [Clostridium botulinum]|nr:hypothetical protein [Clostridium botulinum]